MFCVWFMARNCRFPKVGTPGSQPGNQRLPLQGTAGSHRLEVMVPQPGDQMLPLQATAGSQRLELMLPNQGTIGFHCKEFPIPKGWNWWFPTWEPKVTMARNCRFPKVGTHGCQRGNHRLPLQGTAGSLRLELLVPQLGNHGLPLQATAGYQRLELLVSQPGNHRLPLQRTSGS